MSATEFGAEMKVGSGVLTDLESLRAAVLEWNARTNLVGPSFEHDFWRRHALDSAQLFHVEHQALHWADIGAGAGFPGLVLAILMKHRGDGQIQLVESLGKRVNFLEAMRDELRLPVVIHHGRAERLDPTPSVDVVTARACAPLTKLLGFTKALFDRGAYGLFLKGQSVQQEIREARETWAFAADLLPSMSDPTGSILRVGRVARRG